jgi:putative ABC transport system permease protein
MGDLLQDLRYGLRLLSRSPGFALAAIVSLALGIGANTAIFSVVNTVLLRPLPYPDVDRVMMVWDSNPSRGWDQFAVSPGNFVDWQARQTVFDTLVALRTRSLVLTGHDEPERLSGLLATEQFFDLTGTPPVLGRAFAARDFEAGAGRVVVLTDALWKRRFGGRADILGAPLTLGDETCTVIGVLPSGASLPTGAELLAPLVLTADERQHHGAHYLLAMGRLKAGVAPGAAAGAMRDLARQIEAEHKDSNTGWTVRLVPLYEDVVGGIRPALLLLTAAVGVVLLIACANVANLLLARAATRRGEIAVRAALGAGRGRLVRQLLTESLLLSCLGGAFGLVLGTWAVDVIKTLQPGTLPRVQSLAVDGRVLLFTFLVSVLTGLLFGAVPGMLLSRASLQGTLQQGGRGVRGRLSRRMRGALVAAQVAMSLVLLVAAGLQIRSLGRLLAVHPGFDAANVLTFKVNLPDRRYPDDAQQAAFYDRAVADLAALPGVVSAAAVSSVPISDDDLIFSFTIEGRPPAPPEEETSANWYAVSPDYFKTLRIPLVRGRLFTAADTGTAPRVALINETMARRIFPGQDPLGQHLRMGVDGKVVRTIVGVVGDLRHYGLDQPVTMQMYEPCAQRPWSAMTLLLRAATRPDTLAPAARRAILAIDPGQPVSEVRTLQAIVDLSTAQRRFTLVLLTLFALVALVLASVGLYGVVAYSVTQRTHEIGVRMALGAQRGEILALVLRQGMGMTLWGLLAGLLGAAALARVMSGLLFGVSAHDPITFAATVLILSTVALGAIWVPARRATRVEPTSALRYE